jgi:hypothetical protein
MKQYQIIFQSKGDNLGPFDFSYHFEADDIFHAMEQAKDCLIEGEVIVKMEVKEI